MADLNTSFFPSDKKQGETVYPDISSDVVQDINNAPQTDLFDTGKALNMEVEETFEFDTKAIHKAITGFTPVEQSNSFIIFCSFILCFSDCFGVGGL